MEGPSISGSLFLIVVGLLYSVFAFNSLVRGKFNPPMKIFYILLIVFSFLDPNVGNEPINPSEENDTLAVKIVSLVVLVLALATIVLGGYLLSLT